MKTRLHEGGTERCELSTPSPRARYGIKVAEGGNGGTFLGVFVFNSLTFGKARVLRRNSTKSGTCNVGCTALWRHCTHALAYLCFRSAAPAAKPNLGYAPQGRMQRPWTRSRRGSPDTRGDAPSHTPLTRRVARSAVRGRQRPEAASPAPIMVGLTV